MKFDQNISPPFNLSGLSMSTHWMRNRKKSLEITDHLNENWPTRLHTMRLRRRERREKGNRDMEMRERERQVRKALTKRANYTYAEVWMS
jgi:hypothetical protein